MKNPLDEIKPTKKERLAELRKKLDCLENERSKVVKEYLALKEEITDEEAPKELTPALVLTQPYTAFESKKTHEQLRDYMAQFHQISVDGYFPETNRKSLRIRALKSKKLEHLIGEVKTFLPHLCEITIKKLSTKQDFEYLDDFKAKCIGVSEPSCSQYGVYNLLVTPDKIYLTITTYGRSRILQEFATIEEACQNIHRGKLCNKY